MDSSTGSGPVSPQQAETRLVTAGRDTKAQKGFVNPPVVHGSTVLYPTAEDLHAHRGDFTYGRHGTPTTRCTISQSRYLRRNSRRRSLSYAASAPAETHPMRNAASARSASISAVCRAQA